MLRLACFVVAALLLSLTATGCGGGSPQASGAMEVPTDPAVDQLVEEVRLKHNMPALAAMVVRSDSVVVASASGIRRNGSDARVTLRDRFHLGSNTKAMTATLLAVLVEDGALDWDTTPLDVFPALADSIHPAYQGVTLEQLLSHRAGLPAFTQGEEWNAMPRVSGSHADQRFAFTSHVLRREPALTPASEFHYSNAGYTVAAAMAEQVAGATWEALMRDRLFDEMDIAGEFGYPVAVDSAQPSGHFERGDTLRPSRLRNSYEPAVMIGPAGDVNMNLPDYGRFLQLHLRGLRGTEPALLSSSTIQHMHESQGGMSLDSNLPGYGLGWVVHDYLGARSSSHAGSIGRFKARATIQPSRDLAVAVVANAGGDAADRATTELRESLLKRYGASE